MSSLSAIPEPVANAAGAMSGFERPWALCGGWAVDAWLGGVTREHGDVDITVFSDDQRALLDHLDGWSFVAHDEADPTSTELWTGRELLLPAHVHARPPGEENRELVLRWVTPPYSQAKDGRDFEFVLNERAGDTWVLNREPPIDVAFESSIRASPWGLPTAAPEVIAFYKATAYYGHDRLWNRPHDVADFDALVARAGAVERSWLREAIASMHADHPWLEALRPGS